MPFQIVRNDITKMKADAIVNTANYEPVREGGTDGAIYRAAGETELLAERRKIGRIPVGEAAVTPAFGLDAKYVIHTVGPLWQGGDRGEAEQVRLCYRNSLRAALEHNCESIAFPLISTGVCGFPRGEGMRLALWEISDFLSREEMMVYLVVFDQESFEVSGKLFADIPSYIDRNYVEERKLQEYGVSGAMGRIPVPGSFLRSREAEAVHAAVREEAYSLPAAEKLPVFLQKKDVHGVKRNRKSGRKSWLEEDRAFVPPQALQEREPVGKKVPQRSLEEVVAQVGETFQERLFRLIDQSGMTDVEVYKKANIDRKLFSKIRCNVDYRPGKSTAVALAMALELNLDETRDLLARAEMALSPSSKFDLIITYFIEQGVYDIYTINLALFQHSQPMLGA